MGYSPGGHKELDTTEQLPLTHTGHIQLLRQPSGLLPLLFSLYLSVTVILFLFHGYNILYLSIIKKFYFDLFILLFHLICSLSFV